MSVYDEDIRAHFRVKPGTKIHLKDYDPDWSGDDQLSKDKRKKRAEAFLREDVGDLIEAQERLYASRSWAVLIILQGMDTSGKDGIIKHVMSGVNPQGCSVVSFKKPTEEELAHDFLWRCVKSLPERGKITLFNRSYYEEVLVVKVHPEFLEAQRLPRVDENLWENRYKSINRLERHLTRNGTAVVKFFLHISKEEQRQRLLARLNDPAKLWKFSANDVAERAYWDQYQGAYEQMLNATSTEHAPWHIIPANHKWVARATVARIITNVIDTLHVGYPAVSDEMMEKYEQIKVQLESEGSSQTAG
ncbi:MAG: polyphosphate kinase 2 family protein [Fimbriimonadia bacterium]|nr:polyphosphate kinase 2 family protein [Fimbriimonadia bacterium]